MPSGWAHHMQITLSFPMLSFPVLLLVMYVLSNLLIGNIECTTHLFKVTQNEAFA